jgi:iron complex outermembrane recepter protein
MRRLSLFAVLLASTASTASFAQSAPAEDVSSEDTIIVTAQKREERQIDVPVTITAVTGARLREIGVTDLDELSNYVPGLNIQEQSANNPGIVIRGITSDSGSAQQGARVTLYYNGVDISRSRGSYQDIYDMERVEVVKGPQATLFGTASAVGAISLISARPKEGFSGELTGTYGNFDQYSAGGHLNAGSDQLAGRIAFAYKKRDGYVNNLAAGQEDLYAQDQFGARGSLRFKPSDAVTADLILTYDRQRNSGTPFISLTYPTTSGAPNAFGNAALGGTPNSLRDLGLDKLGLKRDVYDANLTVNWDIADDWTLTLVNGYRKFDSLEVFDADGTAAEYLEFAELAKGDQYNQETRFTYTSDKFRGSFGFNFFHENGVQNVPFSSNENVFLACLTATATTRAQCVAPDGSVPAAALPRINYTSFFENQGRNTSYSVFADGTWIPTPGLEITAGVRVQIEKRVSGFRAGVPRTSRGATSLVPGQIDTAGLTFTSEDSYADVLPRFNLLYRFSDKINAYATVSKGRRSAVVNVGARSTATGPVANISPVLEEVLWNYELGLKADLGIVSGSIGVYYLTYDNFQVSIIIPPSITAVTQSAGSATNKGVEAEINIRPTNWLTMFANGAYIDGGIDNRPEIAPNFRGAKFRLQPDYQASAGLIINAPLGGLTVFATPSITYRSKIFFETPNLEARSQGPVTLVNVIGGVRFGDDRYEISAFARNLFNKRYLLDAGNTGGAFGIPTFIPGEPRFYGIKFGAKF